MDLLCEYFGIRTLLLEGGVHIHGALLEAGLVDEVSVLMVPSIDGRHDIAAHFDGVSTTVARAEVGRAQAQGCALAPV